MKTMKITRKQLRQLISEAMYNPDTFPTEEDKHIPQSMIGGNNQEFKEKVSALSKGGDDYFRTATDLIDNSDELVVPAVVGMRGGYERLANRPTLRVEYLSKDETEMIPVEVPVSRSLWRKVENAVSEKKAGNPSLSSKERLALFDRVVSKAERWILNNVNDVNEHHYTGEMDFEWEDGGYYNSNNDLLDELIS